MFGELSPHMQALTPEVAARDTQAYVDFLDAQPGVAPAPLATTGYCMGGALSLRAAASFRTASWPPPASTAAVWPRTTRTARSRAPHGSGPRSTPAHADHDASMPPEQVERFASGAVLGRRRAHLRGLRGRLSRLHHERHAGARRRRRAAALGRPARAARAAGCPRPHEGPPRARPGRPAGPARRRRDRPGGGGAAAGLPGAARRGRRPGARARDAATRGAAAGRGGVARDALAAGRSRSCRTWRPGARPTGRSAPRRSAPATAWRRCCGVPRRACRGSTG